MSDKEIQGELVEDTEPVAEVTEAPKRRSEMITVEPGRGVALNSLADLTGFAGMVVRAKLAPYGMTADGAAAAMVMGRGFGLNEMAAMQQIVPVNGQLTWRGQAAIALIRNSGKCVAGTLKFWSEGDGENAKGVAAAQRVGDRDVERREFTVEDAKRAGLWPGKEGSGWRKYPKRMLMWRAVGFIARDIFSDVLGGFPLAEEAVDFDDSARPGSAGMTPPPKRELPPPASPDPFMEALSGRSATVQADEPSVDDAAGGEGSAAADGAVVEPESPATEVGDEDTCAHGLVLSVPCGECEEEDAAAAMEAEKSEGEK